MFDFPNSTTLPQPIVGQSVQPPLRAKVAFDKVMAVLLLLPLVVCALTLILLNPVLNKGPLLFMQRRMGQDCKPFTMIKFRTMRVAKPARGAFEPLDADRVTPLGQFLRRCRIDELPQVLNVLRGDMSLIGPRPDCYDHARVYLRDVPGYAARQSALPGISGYAQVKLGYIDDIHAMHRRVAADLYYIAHASFAFDMRIAWHTVIVVLGRQGA
mgnify:CR=1 FL=1